MQQEKGKGSESRKAFSFFHSGGYRFDVLVWAISKTEKLEIDLFWRTILCLTWQTRIEGHLSPSPPQKKPPTALDLV